MDSKERAAKLEKSLQEDPIKFTDKRTRTVGWSFFWRQLILAAPAYAAALLPDFGVRWINPRSHAYIALVGLLLLYFIFVLGLAEKGRRIGAVYSLGNSVTGLVKLGFWIWLFVLGGWILFWIPCAILLFLLARVLSETELLVAALVMWFLLSVPIMGRAVLYLERREQVESSLGGTVSSPGS